MDEHLNDWFEREILTHEAALVRYLSRIWPKRDEVHDLRQETYVRIYEAAAKTRPASPKSFLFAIARHLVSDRLRRARIVSIEAVGDLDELNVMIDEVSPERSLTGRQELKRLAQALNAVPSKCREVIWLRRVDDMPQKAVAQRLGISERTVETHVLRGMRALTDAFLSGTSTQEQSDTHGQSETGSQHGQQHTD